MYTLCVMALTIARFTALDVTGQLPTYYTTTSIQSTYW